MVVTLSRANIGGARTHQPLRLGLPADVCGHPYSSEIRSYAARLGIRSPDSISRYSRTLTPISQAARHTRSLLRCRSRCIIAGYAAKVATPKA